MPTPETGRIVADVRRLLASDALTGRQAKLYSQRIRREMGQPGLATFVDADIGGYIDEAIWIIECALLERSADPNSQWRQGVKRAGEILELLSQGDLRQRGIPLHLLSAAAYQVAGFPAMALAQLARMPNNEPFSNLLREFLRANFPSALEAARQFWASDAPVGARDEPAELEALVVRHTVMCITVVCMHFKTGEERRLERAIGKLNALASGYLHSRDPYSYLLARLTALTAVHFAASSLWTGVRPLANAGDEDTRAALLVPRHLLEAAPLFEQAAQDELGRPLRLDDVAELRWYFRQQDQVDHGGAPEDFRRFRRACRAFRAPRFHVLYRLWKKNGDRPLDATVSPVLQDKIERRRGHVTSEVLPHVYAHLSPLVGSA